MPGSHYFNTPEGARHDRETPLTTPAGTVTIVNYDLWHRAMPNRTDHHRYMVKFLFARMSEPRAPSWANDRADWPGIEPTFADDGPELQKMYAHIWHWHRGKGIAAKGASRQRGTGLGQKLPAIKSGIHAASLGWAAVLSNEIPNKQGFFA